MKNRNLLQSILLLFCLLTIGAYVSVAQNVAITNDDGYTADPSAMLDVKSTDKGMLVPRMNSAQRAAIVSPAKGLLVYDNVIGGFYFYDGSSWINLTSNIPNNLFTQNGADVYLTDTAKNLGIGTSNPLSKLEVRGDVDVLSDAPLFEVINKNGDTVFAVYSQGVQIRVADDPLLKSAGTKGGFAVGGYSLSKGLTNEYLRVTPDSVRVYIEEGAITKGASSKGGFAVGGFSVSKAEPTDYLNIYGASATDVLNPSEPRIFWYPLKESLLSGRVLVESADSIGTNSFASGYQSKPVGDYSQAMGYGCIARGDYSTALGKNSVAQATNSFAFGAGAFALGDDAYAFGAGAKAVANGSYAFGSYGRDSLGNQTGSVTISTGINAIAFGQGAEASNLNSVSFGTNSDASGINSSALGFSADAIGKWSIALGSYSNASGTGSCAINQSSTASGDYSVAIGKNSSATSRSSIAIGEGNTSTSFGTTAMGWSCDATGQYAVAIGVVAEASGTNSIAFGFGNHAIGDNTTTFGYANNAYGDFSLSTGNSTVANGYYSSVFGNYTSSSSYGEFVIGQYNETLTASATTWVSTDQLFVIGNGTNGASRSNAVTVLKNGNTGIGTSAPLKNVHIVGNATVGELLIAPDATTAGDSEIFLAEDNDNTYNMSIKYDGGTNYLYVYGDNGTITNGPHLSIQRDNGDVYMPAVYNDAVGGLYRDLYISSTGKLGYVSSSVRYKDNINDLNEIDWLFDLNPVSYTYKTDENKEIQYGLIAEEVDEVNQRCVSYNEEGKPETVSYSKLITPMLKAIQDQNEEVSDLSKNDNELKARLEELSNENKELKAEIEYIKSLLQDK